MSGAVVLPFLRPEQQVRPVGRTPLYWSSGEEMLYSDVETLLDVSRSKFEVSPGAVRLVRKLRLNISWQPLVLIVQGVALKDETRLLDAEVEERARKFGLRHCNPYRYCAGPTWPLTQHLNEAS